MDLSGIFYAHLASDFKAHNTIRFVEKALKAQRGLSKLEKETTDAFKLLANEFNELYLTTLVAFYIAVHYAQERKPAEALTLTNHALSEIQNCCDFA